MPDEPIEAEGREQLPAVPADYPEPDPANYAEVDVFKRMELEDERQIMEELQGRALDVMLYSFEQDGRRQTGFSWKGAAEAVGTMNRRGFTGIRLKPEIEPRFEIADDGKAIRCVVYAEDAKHGGGNWGVGVQPLKMKKRNGSTVDDPFATHKALSKAQRNAYERLIPLELVEYLKAQYHGEGRVKVIPGADQPEYDRPPPLEDEKALAQVARLREVYAEIKEIDRMVMPPGQFNAIVTQNAHDHDRLDDAIAHLEGFRDGEREIAAERDKLYALVPREDFERELGKLVGLSQQRRLGALRTLVEAAEKQEGS